MPAMLGPSLQKHEIRGLPLSPTVPMIYNAVLRDSCSRVEVEAVWTPQKQENLPTSEARS